MMIWNAAASLQDGDQRDPPVLPPRPEELLPQPVERPPPGQVVEEEEEEVVEGSPPVEVVTAAQRPAQASQRKETDTVSPQTGATVPDRPARVRKKVSKFS